MNRNSSFLRILSTLSIIILIISMCFFAYAKLNIRNINSMKKENNELNNKLEKINKKENEIRDIYDLKEKNSNEIYAEFSSKYGYDFTEGEDSIKSKIIENLKNENNNILKQIALELTRYKEFYSGDYYNDESYTDSVNAFANLLSIKATESLDTDLYNDISLYKFIGIAKKSGTVQYLSKLNKNSKEVDVMLFAISVYSKELNDIVSNEKPEVKNIDEIYTSVLNLSDLYENLENYGLVTGDLSSKRLYNLKNEIFNLNKKYYENEGVIEILEKGDKNEKNE